MTPRRPISSTITRWGLLITTIALSVVLIGMGVVSYVGALQAADSLTRARSVDLIFTARQSLRQSSGEHQDALEELVETMEEQGLRFVAAANRRQGLVVMAGQPSTSLDTGRLLDIQPGPQLEISDIGDRVRVVAQARPRRRLGDDPRRSGRGFWKGDGPTDKARWKNVGRGTRDDGLRRGATIVIEYEPIIAAQIVSRALAMLLISVIAAPVLLIAAIVFWRISRKAEVMSDQLARDRQLKMLGEMSAVLGHELRNPLASLKGHAQLLSERIPEEHPSRRGVERVVREAIRMERLTEQILDFARTGTVDSTIEDPAEVARSAVDESGQSGVDLFIRDGLPPWLMDRLRIERVLINLLKNGVQASPPEAVVDLTVKTDEDGLVFEVRDRGTGLPPGEEAWIFEPFHTKRVRGTGLGLAVSKQIVEAHKGRISAYSHPEGGAVFRIWLPPAETEEASA